MDAIFVIPANRMFHVYRVMCARSAMQDARIAKYVMYAIPARFRIIALLAIPARYTTLAFHV